MTPPSAAIPLIPLTPPTMPSEALDCLRGHISQAIPLAEALLAQVQQLQVAIPRPEGAAGPAATRYRQRVGQYTRRIGEEANAVSSDIRRISGEAGTLRANLVELHATVNQKLGEWESAFATAETGRRSEFDALTSAERDKARQNFATELNALTAKNQKLHDKLVSQQAAQAESLTSLDLSWNERVEALEVEASELTGSLQSYKAQAEDLAGKIAETGLSGRYLQASESEMKAARIWYFLGIILGLGLVAGAAWFLFIYRPGDLGVGESVRRAALIVVGSAIPLFSLREATEHRHAARVYRRLHVELASFGLYLADLPPIEQQKLKIDRVPHYFVGRNDLLDRARSVKAYKRSMSDLLRRDGNDNASDP